MIELYLLEQLAAFAEYGTLSKAAEELIPLPGRTLEVTAAWKPFKAHPRAAKAAATPRIREAVVFFSDSFTERSSMDMLHMGYPSERIRIIPSSVTVAAAIVSMSTEAARTLPC